MALRAKKSRRGTDGNKRKGSKMKEFFSFIAVALIATVKVIIFLLAFIITAGVILCGGRR